MSGPTAFFWLVTALAAIGLRRLSRWRDLPPPLRAADSPPAGDITIVVPTFNEVHRLAPLLEGLCHQSSCVVRALIVDSGSTDGTVRLVEEAALQDPRIELMRDDPLPAGWIGKAWALECARKRITTKWILSLDADTAPRHELAASIASEAERENYDAVSLAPRFAGQSPLERWMQPSLLISLLYRFAPAVNNASRRVLANGQCFLVKRDVLEKAGGFAPVRESFAEDVSLARHLTSTGARVAFLDGSQLYDVRSYAGAAQMWREWGRSIDLKDATTLVEQLVDVLSIITVQGMPLVVLALAAFSKVNLSSPLFALCVLLIGVRVSMLFALRSSYAVRGFAYWLSPLSDPLAALRVCVSSLRRPTSWRGRSYR